MSTYTIFSSTADGYIQSQSNTYADAREGTGTATLTTDTTSDASVGHYRAGDNSYIVQQIFLTFDTSSVTGPVASATLSLWGVVDGSTRDFTAQARLYDWGTLLTNADFRAGSTLSGLTLLATRSSVGFATGAYNAFTESGNNFALNINKTGSTRFLINSDEQVTGTAPSPAGQTSYFICSTADVAGTTQDPKLVVVTTDPFSTAKFFLALGQNVFASSPTWTEIPWQSAGSAKGFVREFHFTSSGRSLDIDDFEGGSGTVVLDNSDGRFTPGNTASPYYPNIRLRMPFKMEATRGVVVLTVRGYVDATPVKFPTPPNKSICEWPLVDAFTLFEDRAGEYPWTMVIRRDAPKLWLNYDELSGTTAIDDSGNGHNGTYINNPTLQIAFGTGTGVTFDGSTQEADFPSAASITGTGDFAVEFYGDTTSTGGDEYFYVQYDFPSAQGIRCGIASTGQIVFLTADGSGTTNLTGTATDNISGPEKHIICRRQGTTHEILINGVVDATTTGTARNIPAVAIAAPGVSWAGTVDRLMTYQGTITQAVAQEHFQALLAWLMLTTGQQVDYILDAVGWPSGDRNTDAGNSTMLGQFAPAGSVLDMLRLAANSDFGALYMTLDGKVRFRERQAIWKSPYTTSQGTFGNGATAQPVVIQTLEPDYDASRIRNDIALKVHWQTGPIDLAPYDVEVRKSDTTSVAAYGARTWSRDVYTAVSGGTAATAVALGDIADLILTRYKDPLREIRKLQLAPHANSSDAFWNHVLQRTQEDRITHTHTAPGGEVISGDYHIQRISHDIGPGKVWRTEWVLTPADALDFWIWDTSTWNNTTRWGA